MQNLKINSTSTPYWCVVVPVDASDIQLHRTTDDRVWLTYYQDGIGTSKRFLGEMYPVIKIGCITSSGMDEWVREIVGKTDSIELYMDYGNIECDQYSFKTAHESALSLLTHNQITLTDSTKAVVLKQKA